MATAGKKDTLGKPAWDTLDMLAIQEMAERAEYGARKYNEDPNDLNWKKVKDPMNKYFAAAMRHLVAWRSGEIFDPEAPGTSHIGACLWNLHCLAYFTRQTPEYKKQKAAQ